MKNSLATLFAAGSILLCGGMTGAFYAFSVGVMPGLDATRAPAAIAAMQGINQKIVNPVFLVSFLGLPVAAGAAGALLLAIGQKPAALLFFATAAVYVLGALLPTFAINIPMNDRLDATTIPADLDEAARIWADYSPRWTAWNTFRTVSSAISLLLAALGAYVWGRNA